MNYQILILKLCLQEMKQRLEEEFIKLGDRIENDTFIVSYGDCLADVDIDKLISFHKKQNKIATITVTKLHSRFGFVELDNNSIITSFREKEKEKQLYSIGFMVFNRKIFDYLDENIILKKEPFTNLVKDGESCIRT